MNNNQNITRQKIYLAALLHDIGKFVFRSQNLKAGEGHELLGEQFIREHFGKIHALQNDIEYIVDQSKHHKTNSYTAFADRIVSSERTDENNKNARRPILSIFNDISIDDIYKSSKSVYYYLPDKININNIFPVYDNTAEQNQKWNYDEEKSINKHYNLLKEFVKEIKSLANSKSLKATNSSIYHLLHKYTARVLSAGYYSKPDISLFDHSRATAGFVNCLTYNKQEDELRSIKTYDKFIYIKGDLKGIQKFIYYNVKMFEAGQSRGTSKRLRGRSFLVSMLTDFIASLFLERLELAEANLLYAGGGHFNIISPYSEEIQNKLNVLIEEINLELYNKLGTRISLVVGTTVTDKDLYKNTSKYIAKVNFDLLQNKNTIHKSYLDKIIFDKNKSNIELDNTREDEDKKLGQKLPYTNYILVIKSKQDLSKDKNCLFYFKNYDTYFFFIEEKSDYGIDILKLFNKYSNDIDSVKIIKINDSDFLEHADNLLKTYNFPISFGFKFFGQFTPTSNKEGVLEFEDIAKLNDLDDDKKELTYPQLAVMRLDVDNLGTIFEFGLDEFASFSRIANLSRELDLFFSGYFNVLAEKWNVYITYSGGDDAFIVGSWLNILHFAKDLYQDFKKFVCNNEDITFSAGIFMCDEHFPVAKFAEKAAELEEVSKNFKNKSGIEKNAITVFDHTLEWKEYCAMIDFSEKLLENTNKNDNIKDKNKLNRSLVHKLLIIIKSSMKKGHVDVVKMNRNIAQLHYLFARHGFDANEIKKMEKEITKEIIKVILENFSKKDIIKNYLIPTNYVILKTRKIK